MPSAIETRLKFGAQSEKLVAEWYAAKAWNITWPKTKDSWDLTISNKLATTRIKVTRDLSMASTGYHSILFERNQEPAGIALTDIDIWCVVDLSATAYSFEINKLRSYIKRLQPVKTFQMHRGIAHSIKFDKMCTDLKPMEFSLKPQKVGRYEF
jgi:hypothetical protein